MFRVSDEITDMTRSLKMAERYRLIYRTIVFGHRKCSGVPGTYRVTGRGSGHPLRQRYGPYWAIRERRKRASRVAAPLPLVWSELD